jgi:D-beta-D-heptose 7-phosphate kinase/D-beta-D-heptose 1-phosphate adenosyltransferase
MIVSLVELKALRRKCKENGKTVVFTNGCFDIIHAGHVDYLNKAKVLGDILIVGLNSDKSVRRIKGEKRPIIDEQERAFILSNLKAVDYVVFFEEDTPENLIKELIPDILIKGSDWSVDSIVGKDTVISNGGEVKTIDFITNQSTSGIIKRILEKYDN